MLGIASTATILPITGLFLLLGIYLWKKQQRVWAIWGIGNLIVVSGIGQVMKWLIQRPRPVLEAGMVRRFTQLSQWPYPASCYTGDYLFAFHSIFV